MPASAAQHHARQPNPNKLKSHDIAALSAASTHTLWASLPPLGVLTTRRNRIQHHRISELLQPCRTFPARSPDSCNPSPLSVKSPRYSHKRAQLCKAPAAETTPALPCWPCCSAHNAIAGAQDRQEHNRAAASMQPCQPGQPASAAAAASRHSAPITAAAAKCPLLQPPLQPSPLQPPLLLLRSHAVCD